MISKPDDEMFDVAKNFWNRLQEFVDNHAEVSEYVLKRTYEEYTMNKLKEKGIDFNAFYKDVFSNFVLTSYALIRKRLYHAPSTRCLFRIPDDESMCEEIKSGVTLKDGLERKWDFIADVPEKYLTSLQDLVKNPLEEPEWTKHIYVEERTVQRYVGAATDGQRFLLEKVVLDCYHKKFSNVLVIIQAKKFMPEGPFTYEFELRCGDKQFKSIQRRLFATERTLDDFVALEMKRFDGEYEKASTNKGKE